jgi:hypothetical protein
MKRYLDAHEDQGLERPFIEHGEELGRGHREERLFDGAKVQLTKRGKVETVVGLAKSWGQVPEQKQS